MNDLLENLDIGKLMAEMGYPMTHMESEHLDWLGQQKLIRGWGGTRATPDDTEVLFSLTKDKAVGLVAEWHAERSASGAVPSDLRARYGERVGYELSDDQWQSATIACGRRLVERVDALTRLRLRH